MGFKISKASDPSEIIVPLDVNVTYEIESGEPETLEVRHVFRIPTRSEREKHQQLMVKVRGQSVKSVGSTEANFWLWKQCFIRLEGYDDLPETRQQIINTFEESEVLHLHAENAISALLNHITGAEGDIVKK